VANLPPISTTLAKLVAKFDADVERKKERLFSQYSCYIYGNLFNATMF
jgi:hypothetical protein